MAQPTGAHGWPLVPSKRFPGEQTLGCPRCMSHDVTMSVQYPVRGSGPMGRGRLGDLGSREYAECQTCGMHSLYYRPDKRYTR
jgi:hypothetical protein